MNHNERLDANIGRREIGVEIGCGTVRVLADVGEDVEAKLAALRADLTAVVARHFPGCVMPVVYDDGFSTHVCFDKVIKPRVEREADYAKWQEDVAGIFRHAREAEAAARAAHPDNGKRGFWQVDGIRHDAYVTASSAQEAYDKAIASGDVGDWESPTAAYVGEKLPADQED